jgi:putative transposase
MKLVRETIESLVVPRPEPSEEQPQGMCLDKEPIRITPLKPL